MVAAAAQKTNWKKKKARVGMVRPGYTSGRLRMANHSVPKNALPEPNIRPKPTKIKPRVLIVVSMKFSAMMLTTCLERTNPASRKPKPACMKNTRNAATSTHTVSSAFTSGCSPCAAAVWARTSSSAPTTRTFANRRHVLILRFIIFLLPHWAARPETKNAPPVRAERTGEASWPNNDSVADDPMPPE